ADGAEVPFIEEALERAEILAVVERAAQFEERCGDDDRRHGEPLSPSVDVEVAAAPTDAEVDADDPEKLPGPEIEGAHFVERDVGGDDFADKRVLLGAESKLSHAPDHESCSENVFPRDALRDQ